MKRGLSSSFKEPQTRSKSRPSIYPLETVPLNAVHGSGGKIKMVNDIELPQVSMNMNKVIKPASQRADFISFKTGAFTIKLFTAIIYGFS